MVSESSSFHHKKDRVNEENRVTMKNGRLTHSLSTNTSHSFLLESTGHKHTHTHIQTYTHIDIKAVKKAEKSKWKKNSVRCKDKVKKQVKK